MSERLIKNMRRGGYEQPQGRMIMVAADEIERLRISVATRDQEIENLRRHLKEPKA